ncbi:NAD(P)-dependent oxidoreductase [Candidatus Woesearchaeota archaeon]|nr:NAD(P)-dependent oxidoreductase [Candidatus Woesearchaeota archaeon]
MANKRILVIGGSGYIGKEIVKELISKNYNVTILSRSVKKDVISCNILNKEELIKKIKGFDLIIYLAAVIRTIKKSKYNQNIIGLSNTLESMKLNKITNIIYFSTQNVYLKKTGPYGNSKKLCEKLLVNSNLNYIILRPNYVYGIDKENDFYKLSIIIKNMHICPIYGRGNTNIQPVNKQDIAKTVVFLVEHFKAKSTFDLSGKTTISLNEISNYLAEKSNSWCIKVHIPMFLLKFFKIILPFDVDGLDIDRISILKNNPCKISSDLKKDLNNILKL